MMKLKILNTQETAIAIVLLIMHPDMWAEPVLQELSWEESVYELTGNLHGDSSSVHMRELLYSHALWGVPNN